MFFSFDRFVLSRKFKFTTELRRTQKKIIGLKRIPPHPSGKKAMNSNALILSELCGRY
jgi:hypothetical protein